jgi:uncharacterized NAD(P)/FAD-binding protein YdhS
MNTIVIAGAGFSGVASAIQLLRRATGDLHVILINRSGPMGRGLAYGTASPDHLLNVPAGNMSVLADDPSHFLDYCRRLDPSVTAGTFVARRIYGDYLAWALDQGERQAPAGVRLTRLTGRVVAVTRQRCNTLRVQCEDGGRYEVDRVLLALGHAPARDPGPVGTAIAAGPRYVRDPWRAGALDGLVAGDRVLLLGTGLTAVDVANTMLRSAPGVRMIAMSRRGLVPQPHRDGAVAPTAADVSAVAAQPPRVRAQLRALRHCVDATLAGGGDWRDVVAALRPLTASWWQALPLPERSRFLRHLQPYWDVHRHRVAPAAYASFAMARQDGVLHVQAGRVLACEEHPGGVIVRYRARGACTTSEIDVARVINCTGTESDPQRMADPLVRQLLEDGLMQADPLGQGVLAAADGALVDAAGQCSSGLYYLGPLLKARDWEATAVPELRRFALEFARQMLRDWGLAADA